MISSERAHAVIIGGGMAGLLAARVLLNHFEKVSLIELDHYPEAPLFRAGTPQARHLHTTLLKGQQILEEWFPGLCAKLLTQGALERDYGNQALYVYNGKPCPVIPPVLHGWNASRMLLEWQIRQELLKYDQFRIIEGHVVVGLLFSYDKQSIIGVKYHARTYQPDNPVQEMQADLVVDASGSSSRVVEWLESLGYKAPQETVVDTGLGYATQHYRAPDIYALKGIVIQATQQVPRTGVLMTIENGHWIITLGGVQGDYPPLSQIGFTGFAESLPDKTLYEAMQMATPISPIYGYRRTENRLRHFEGLRKLEGIVIVGDALCTFNPIYGQGMTVAALEAQALDACLARIKGQRGLAHAFQQRAARILRSPWLSATTADKQKKGWAAWYRDRVISSASHDPQTFLTVLQVAHMLRSPMALLHPVTIAKVLADRLFPHKE